VRVELLDYQLPSDRIALEPPAEREGARMLLLGAGASFEDSTTAQLDRHLSAGSLLVLNDTRVVPARLLGKRRGSGGRVELLLVRRLDGDVDGPGEGSEERWLALGRASKALRPGTSIEVDGPPDSLDVEVLAKHDDDGTLELRLTTAVELGIGQALERCGHVPLPPYIRGGRRAQASDTPADDDPRDRERYQTVYARAPGAVAAPTAGLHLSRALLSRIEAAGVQVTAVTLHVGLGTFQPVTVDDLDEHRMHLERFSIPAEAVAAIADARARGAPVVAVGTTVVRALESAADPERPGHVRAGRGETRLLIQPGYRFRVVDRLLTNFHLPRSTLLALVAAFAGRERVLWAYRAAIDAGYRFYSYGDAMLVDRAEVPA
jgi:S-adenosylmethionine:tRNA ribosyltransferase-isomerase